MATDFSGGTSEGCCDPGQSSAGAPTDAEYALVATNGVLTQARTLAVVTGELSLTDGGPGSTLTFGLPDIVTPGTVTNATLIYDSKGRVTAASSGVPGVTTTRTLTAGDGLTGGGTLATDLTFDIVASDSTIVVAADGIRVDPTALSIPSPATSVTDVGASVVGDSTLYARQDHSHQLPTAGAGAGTIGSSSKLVRSFTLDAQGRVTAGSIVDLGVLATGVLKVTTSTGALSVAAASDIPSLLTTKGDLLGFSTLPLRVGVGTDGWVLTADAASSAGFKWADIPTILTTKGDLATFSTVKARLGVGTDGYVLTADATQTTGLKWAAAASTGADALGSYLVQSSTHAPTNAQNLGALTSGLMKLTVTTGVGVVSAASSGTDYEVPLTFSNGVTRSSNTVKNDLITGKSGGQTAVGDTASGGNLTLNSTAHATKGSIILDSRLTVPITAAGTNTTTVFGNALNSATGAPHQIEFGNSSGNTMLRVGQDGTHNLGFNWNYNATSASATGELNTFGNTNAILINAATLQLQPGSSATSRNVLIGTTTNVASTLLRVDASKTVASATSAVWDGFDSIAATLTLSGSTAITTATGVNANVFRAPTLSAASALTVTNAATVAISGAPVAGGAGPATITNAYSLWAQGGNARFDGNRVTVGGIDIQNNATGGGGTSRAVVVTGVGGGADAFIQVTNAVSSNAGSDAWLQIVNHASSRDVYFRMDIGTVTEWEWRGVNGTNDELRLKELVGGKVAARIQTNGNWGFGDTNSFGSGVGVVAIKDATTEPTVAPTGGILLWSFGGQLKAMGASGVPTVLVS